jgi:hypothetical protein
VPLWRSDLSHYLRLSISGLGSPFPCPRYRYTVISFHYSKFHICWSSSGQRKPSTYTAIAIKMPSNTQVLNPPTPSASQVIMAPCWCPNTIAKGLEDHAVVSKMALTLHWNLKEITRNSIFYLSFYFYYI